MDLNEIAEIEQRYCRSDGEPVLGQAYAHLKDRWKAGRRDRETCLRLLFLAWYSCAEPTWLTGLPLDEDTTPLFGAIFTHLEQAAPSDPELLFVVGYMAALWPWCCGETNQWERTGRDCLRKFQASGESLASESFSGRGTYGSYFAHIIASRWIEEYMEATIRGEQSTRPGGASPPR